MIEYGPNVFPEEARWRKTLDAAKKSSPWLQEVDWTEYPDANVLIRSAPDDGYWMRMPGCWWAENGPASKTYALR